LKDNSVNLDIKKNNNFIQDTNPACDGRCVQNLGTNSPKRADLLITC